VKIFTDLSMDKEELIKFWKLSRSWCRNYVNCSSTLRYRAFSTICLISLNKLIGCSVKFYHKC